MPVRYRTALLIRFSPAFAIFLCQCLIGLLSLVSCQSKDDAPVEQASAVPTDQTPIEVMPPRLQDWYMFMHDLQQSGRSSETVLKPPLELKWRFKTGGQVQASPVVANDIVYIGSTDHIFYALEAKSWGVKWTFDAAGAIRFSAVVWNGLVFFSATDNHIYALQAETGQEVWRTKVQTWVNCPLLVSNGTIYAGAYSDTIYVLRASDGQLVQKTTRQIQINDIDFACYNGKLTPRQPLHQADRWRKKVPFTHSYPVVANGTVYIGARDKHLYAFDSESEEVVWTHETAGYIDGTPAIADGMLYAASYDGYVYAFGVVSSPKLKPLKPLKKVQPPTWIVVRDRVPVYEKPPQPADRTDQSILVKLNAGMAVLISSGENRPASKSQPLPGDHRCFRQIVLPNGRRGWIESSAVGQFFEKGEVQFNRDICQQIEPISLINGAEVPHRSPDGKSIAFLRRTDLSGQYWRASELWTTDAKGKRFRKQCKGNFYNPNLSWSLDSNLIVFEAYEGEKSYIWAMNPKTKALIKVAEGDAPACSPVANQIVFRQWKDGEDILYRVNVDGGGLTVLARIPIEGKVGSFVYLDPPAWSPNGQQIALGIGGQHFSSGQAQVEIYTINGQKVLSIPTQYRRIRNLAWSADGTYLAHVQVGSNKLDPVLDKRLHITNFEQLLDTQILKHTAPTWSPIGRRVAFMERADCMGVQWMVWVYDLETGSRLQVARTDIRLTSIDWLPGGQRLSLWHTSKYLRGYESAERKYKPAETKGWVVTLKKSNG